MSDVLGWTDERVELLKTLRADGYSGDHIAKTLGISRSAALGKCHRLGLCQPVQRAPRQQPQRVRRAPIRLPALTRQPADEVDPIRVDLTSDQPSLPVHPVLGRRLKTLIELESDACRWPVGTPGDPDFGFCGARGVPVGASYCATHYRMSYQPTVRTRAHHVPGTR